MIIKMYIYLLHFSRKPELEAINAIGSHLQENNT